MRKKLLIIILLFITFNLSAIGFGFHILELRTMPDFGANTFPTSLVYQFNFPMPDFLSGNTTLLAFRLDNGMEERLLKQNPDDGRIIDTDSTLMAGFTNQEARKYTTHYDEFLLIYEQGFFGQDLVKFHFSFGGRFELSFERLFWMFDNKNTEGLFYKSPDKPRYPSSSWAGAPELAGNRNIFQTFLNFGLSFNYLKDEETVKNGISLDSMLRLSPIWMPLTDKTADFISLYNVLKINYTPIAVYQKGNHKEYTNFSLVLGNDLSYRWIMGEKVPYYIQGGVITGAYVPNTSSIITNRTYVSIYGPQIAAKDCYPVVTGFHELGYSFGDILNMNSKNSFTAYVGTIGFRAEFNIYNICRLYYQMGYVYKTAFSDETKVITSFGFTLGV